MGTVYLVGGGPGDPELLTRKAYRLIGEADDLVVDALVPPTAYAHARGRVVYVGKRAGRPHISQQDIGSLLVSLAARSPTVVRLKGGDPGVLGRLGEELDALDDAGVLFEVVPGVSSALASAAAAKMPLTERGVAQKLTVLTARRAGGELAQLPLYDSDHTLVILMGYGQRAELATQALTRGYPQDLPVAVVSRASCSDEYVVPTTLEELSSVTAKTPATIVLGHVARRAVASELCSLAHAASRTE